MRKKDWHENGSKDRDAAKTQLLPRDVYGELHEYKRGEQLLMNQRNHMAVRNDHTCRSLNSFNKHLPYLSQFLGHTFIARGWLAQKHVPHLLLRCTCLLHAASNKNPKLTKCLVKMTWCHAKLHSIVLNCLINIHNPLHTLLNILALKYITVEPLYNGHHWGPKFCLL